MILIIIMVRVILIIIMVRGVHIPGLRVGQVCGGTGGQGEVGQEGGVLGVVLAAPRRVPRQQNIIILLSLRVPRQPDVNKILLSYIY